MALRQVVRELLDGLPDYLEVVEDRIARAQVGIERLARRTCEVSPHAGCGLEDVLQVEPKVPGHPGLLRGPSREREA